MPNLDQLNTGSLKGLETTVNTIQAAPIVRTATGRRTGHSARRRSIIGYLLVAPALALSAVFFIVPLVLLVVMSFFQWPLFGVIRPFGLQNYAHAFTDPDFGRALRFTLLLTVVLVPLQFLVSYAAAIMVRGRGAVITFIRTTFFLPVVIGFTAAAYMASIMLTPGTGIANVILHGLGVTDGQTKWFTSAHTAFIAVVILTVWKHMGISMILIMAGMQAIPVELHEAARVDGAGWWSREALLTFPLIRRQLALCLILSLSGTLLTFDQFYVLTMGGPSGSTVTLVLYTYTQSFLRYNLGYGAALSVLITVIILIVAAIQLRVLRAAGSNVA